MKLKMAPTLIALALAAAGTTARLPMTGTPVSVLAGHMPTIWMILAKTLIKMPPH